MVSRDLRFQLREDHLVLRILCQADSGRQNASIAEVRPFLAEDKVTCQSFPMGSCKRLASTSPNSTSPAIFLLPVSRSRTTARRVR